MRQKLAAGALVVTTLFAACSDDARTGLDTGLTGTVVRGPTQPVCRQDDPCEDEPFAALFHVRSDGVTVATFESADDGTFSAPLPPGAYLVVPDSTAPIIAPEQQSQSVQVGPVGFTEVYLSFDTGIR